MKETSEINYGDGVGGILFEDEVENYVDKHKIKHFREHKIEGKGKTWKVDFFIPSLNAILFCKKTNPKASLTSEFFLSDVCRIIDLLSMDKFRPILLYHEYTTSLNNVLLCTSYNIYLLYSINGLFILTEEAFGSSNHVTEINELYIKLRSSEKLAFAAFTRRKKLFEIIKKYPQTRFSLQEKFGFKDHQLTKDIEYLRSKDLIFSRRYGGQGGPNHFFTKPEMDLLDFIDAPQLLIVTDKIRIADMEEQLRLVQEYIKRKG